VECVCVATMRDNWWKVEDWVGGKPSIFLFQSSSSQLELSCVGVCGRLFACGQVGQWFFPMWSMFHDNIGVFVWVFSKFLT
jgi:hypothetical protein